MQNPKQEKKSAMKTRKRKTGIPSAKTAAAVFLILCLAAVTLLAGCSSQTISPETEDNTDLIVVGFSQVGAESDWRNANTKSMQ